MFVGLREKAMMCTTINKYSLQKSAFKEAKRDVSLPAFS